jgi:hypothetical protein
MNFHQIKSNKDKYFLYALLIGFLCYLFFTFFRIGQSKYNKPRKVYVLPVVPDTIKLNKPAPIIKVERPAIPTQIKKYSKPDTTRREALEQSNILTGVKINDKVEIHSITLKGFTEVAVHKLPADLEIPEITIDPNGAITVSEEDLKKIRRKKKWRKIGNKASIVGSVVLGVLIGSQLSN